MSWCSVTPVFRAPPCNPWSENHDTLFHEAGFVTEGVPWHSHTPTWFWVQSGLGEGDLVAEGQTRGRMQREVREWVFAHPVRVGEG